MEYKQIDSSLLLMFLITFVVLTIGTLMETNLDRLQKQKQQTASYFEPLTGNVYDYTLLSNEVIEIGHSDKAIKLIIGDDVLGYIWVPISQLRADRNNNLWVSKWWIDKNWTEIQKKKYFKTYLGEHANTNR